MNLEQLQIAVQRQAAIELLVLLLLCALWIWIMYAVSKAAIRDAIKESGVVEELRDIARALRKDSDEGPITLPNWTR